MVSEISDETKIQASAAKVWELYSGLELRTNFIPLHLPNLIEKAEVLECDGGEGTLLISPLHLFKWFVSYKEKFVKIDNEKCIKIAEMVEGGYLDLGFTFYKFCLEIVEKDEGSCIVKSSVQYELMEKAAANISLASVQPLITISQAVNNYFVNTQQA